jgi:ABC-type sugar transport system ATPase subunit
MSAENNVLIQLLDISKRYGGLQALDNVSIDIRKGEVHAVVGENGAGKSTMMKIVGGIVQRDSGTIIFDGRPVEFATPHEAIDAGIAVIHQELSVLPTLNVIENVFMGRMPSRGGRVLWREMERSTREVLALVGLEIDPFRLMDDLTISQRQLIEIAKALSFETKVIIMDEPNSSLAESETEKLFSVIREMKGKGISIIYVSHKIDEVIEISDRISVLRDGKYIGTEDVADSSADSIIQMMVGRKLTRERVENPNIGEVCFEVRGLTSPRFRNVSFDLRRGEILCFSGLVGAGRSEVMRVIFGVDSRDSGEILHEGKPVHFRSPAQAIEAGFAMVPEDRKKLSLFMELPIRFNMSIARLPRLKKNGVINRRAVRKLNEEYKQKLNIKMGSFRNAVSSLSGGNQQKTVLGRWLATDPKILILDEPTHGIDVGAKAEIYRLIRELTTRGISIILISSELPEVIAMADRVVVMHEGTVTGILGRKRMTEETIMSCATGSIDPELASVE